MNKIKLGLLIEGVLSVILAFTLYFLGEVKESLYLLSLPFILLGAWLHDLSLMSLLGNAFAIVIYVLICVIPILFFLFKIKKSSMQKSDSILFVISLYLFFMLYQFINPALMMKHIPDYVEGMDFLPIVKLAYASIFYLLCFSYFVFHMLESLHYGKVKNRKVFLCNELQKLLVISAALYIFLVGYFCTFEMFKEFHTFQAQSSQNQDLFPPMFHYNAILDNSFILLTYLLNVIPIFFSIAILIGGVHLLKSMIDHHLQNGEITAAIHLGRISKITVIITVICNLMSNILQFIFSNQLSNTKYSLQISFTPLIIAFAAYILAGYFKESKALYDENNMII